MSARVACWAALLMTCACAPEPEGPDLESDADGDGLTLGFEQAVGTSDEAADSDGDGCGDALEVLAYFDPLDADDRPYAGAYPRGPRPSAEALAGMAAEDGEGFAIGELAQDWSLVDQHGEPVALRDFYGQVVLIDVAAEWCAPCRAGAPELEQLYAEHADDGFVVLQLIIEGLQDNSAPDSARWAESLALSYPVLADHSPGDHYQTEVMQYYVDIQNNSISIPNYSLINRAHRLVTRYDLSSPDPRELEALLDEEVPAVDVLLPDDAEALRADLGVEGWVVPAEACEG